MAAGLRIFTPVGMLGYGYTEARLWKCIDTFGIDAMIIDSGSTDSGPSKLALGGTTVGKEAYAKDLGPMVAACHFHRIPILVGSAGGDGANDHVDLLVDIVREVIQEKSYRSMKILKLYSEIPKAVVQSYFDKGQVTPCTPAVPTLTQADIDDPPRIVAQMGHEPWLKAMNENPDFDVIIAGRSYDPAPYAAYCLFRGITDLGIAYHMGKIMECGAFCASPKTREALAVVRNDSFDVRTLDPKSKCTNISVAAHLLYEKSRPDILHGPGGTLHLQEATYEELPDGEFVRCRGAKFVQDNQYTLKLEAARTRGFHAIYMGGFRDPILTSQIGPFIETIKETVKSKITFPYSLDIRVYGKNGILGRMEPEIDTQPMEVFVVGQACADTQEQAKQVVNLARIYSMHGTYEHQVATAGNLAMPVSPLDITLGPLTEFCMYHLIPVADSVELFPIEVETCEGSGECKQRHEVPKDPDAEYIRKVTEDSHMKPVKPFIRPNPGKASLLRRQPSKANHVFLAEVAAVIRSKNAGPYELTFDVMFSTDEIANAVKSTGILSPETIARLYKIKEEDIIACMWWDPARAFKTTIKRPVVSGGFAETDGHGSNQHVPLMYLEIPCDM